MAYGNNNENEVKVNTKGYTFKNMEQQRALAIDMWNDKVTVKFYGPLPEEKRTEKAFFDWTNNMMTTLDYYKLVVIIKAIKEKVLPAIEKQEKVTVGIPIKVCNGALIITTGEDGQSPELYLYKDMNEQRIPKESVSYKFVTDMMINKYDATTGECEIESNKLIEFNVFYSFLQNCLYALHSGITHGIKFHDNYYRYNGKTSGGGEKKNYQNNNLWGTPNNSGNETTKADNISAGSIDEMQQFLGN